MTRDEAIKILVGRSWKSALMVEKITKKDYRELMDVVDFVISLFEKDKPDAETGLAPCGCGGKAVMRHRLAKQQEAIWYVRCDKCDVATAECFWELAAKNDWNVAMGYTDTTQGQ